MGQWSGWAGGALCYPPKRAFSSDPYSCHQLLLGSLAPWAQGLAQNWWKGPTGSLMACGYTERDYLDPHGAVSPEPPSCLCRTLHSLGHPEPARTLCNQASSGDPGCSQVLGNLWVLPPQLVWIGTDAEQGLVPFWVTLPRLHLLRCPLSLGGTLATGSAAVTVSGTWRSGTSTLFLGHRRQ